MNNATNRVATSSTHRRRRCVWVVFALCAVVFASGHAWAEPVTFRFEGAIGPPRTGTFPIDLPFTFAEGDPISGSFTFEPVDVASGVNQTEALQSGRWTLEVDSIELRSETYLIQVIDNLTSDEDPTPHDRIVLQCLIGSSCRQTHVEGFPQLDWGFSWSLFGSSSILDGADIPGKAAIWNQFHPKTILATFHDTAVGRSGGFQAVINSFELVPEPGTGVLTASAVLVLPFMLDRRQRRSF